MNLTSAEARKRWGEVLDAAMGGDVTVVSRRGRPVVLVAPWRPPGDTFMLLLAAAMGSGWRAYDDRPRGVWLLLHRSGLWVEVDEQAAIGMSVAVAEEIARALANAVEAGMVGQSVVGMTITGPERTVTARVLAFA